MLRADSLSGDQLRMVSERLPDWFDPVMTEKMRSAATSELPGADLDGLIPPTAALTEDSMETLPESSFELEETSYAVYMLELNKIADAIRSGSGLSYLNTRNTGRSHHQIRTNGAPTGYARTELADDGTTEVCQVFVSDLARAFDRAIAWLNQFEVANPDYVKTDPVVRVLVVPAYHIHALWLLHEIGDGSDIMVIDAPTEMAGLDGERLLSSNEFLQAFEGVLPKSGLLFDEPSPGPQY